MFFTQINDFVHQITIVNNIISIFCSFLSDFLPNCPPTVFLQSNSQYLGIILTQRQKTKDKDSCNGMSFWFVCTCWPQIQQPFAKFLCRQYLVHLHFFIPKDMTAIFFCETLLLLVYFIHGISLTVILTQYFMSLCAV